MKSTAPSKKSAAGKSKPENIYTETLRRILRPRPRISGSEWADRYRIIAPGTSPEPGPWRTSRVPYMKEPLDLATRRSVEKVVIMAASQVAKSELLMCVMGYYIDQEPSPQLMLQPTVEMAEVFSKERVDPTIRHSPALRDKVEGTPADSTKGSSRKSSNTIRMKKFAGGYLYMVGSNSPAGLASHPIRVVLLDEIDRYGSTKEGDPVKLAIQRTANFGNRKIVMVSTPTVESRPDGPTIYSEWLKTDRREFFVKCPHCGKRFVMKWEHVKWEKDKEGNPRDETVHMECPHCHATVRDGDRPDPELIESGVWEKTAQSAVPGFHISSLCSPWVRLTDLVREFSDAVRKRDRDGLQEFVNLKLGEPWQEFKSEAQSWEKLMARRETYPQGAVPDGVLFMTCGVDVQRDRLEASVYGWGLGRESWLVSHDIIYGNPLENAVWEKLDTLLFERKWATASGRGCRLVATLVDSGDGTTTDKVYAYTRPRQRRNVASCKGRGGLGIPFIGRPTHAGAQGAVLYVLGVDAGKEVISWRLALETQGPGYIHFPRNTDGIDEEFFQQLTAETQRTERDSRGREKKEWVKLRDRNEALDCLVYATAAMEAINPDFEKIKKNIGA